MDDGSDMVQKGCVPMGRSGCTMNILKQEADSAILLVLGGINIPKPGPIKYHPTDSNLFLLKYPEMHWTKLPSHESFNRSFHGMHIHGNIIYVVGGYRFENNVATKLYPLSEVTRVILSENQEYQVDIISLDTSPELLIPWTSGFAFCGVEENLYLYSGNVFPDYQNEKNEHV